MKKATFIKIVREAEARPEAQFQRYVGPAALYKLSEPEAFGFEPYDDDEEDERVYSEYVVVSCGGMGDRPETYMFPSEPDGEWGSCLKEGRGSFQGAWNMRQCLIYAGYQIEALGSVTLPEEFKSCDFDGIKRDDQDNPCILR